MDTIHSWFQPRIMSSDKMARHISKYMVKVMTQRKNKVICNAKKMWSILVVSDSANLKDVHNIFLSDEREYPRTMFNRYIHYFQPENFVGAMMDWSLEYNLVEVKVYGECIVLLLVRSKDGSTNIDANVIQILSKA